MIKRINRIDCISNIMSICILTCVAFFAGYCCFYGICQSDESLYFALCDRLWKGDRLITDEWSPVQLYAIVYYPMYSLFRLICKDGTGVYIFFRLLSVFLSYVTAIFWFLLFKNRDRVISLICSCIIIAFQPAGIEGISYYSTSFIAAIWAVMCMEYIVYHPKNFKTKMISAMFGVVLSVLVLSMPYMIVWVIGVAVYWWMKKVQYRFCVVYSLIGTVLFGVISILKFTNVNIKSWVQNFPYILNPPEHGDLLYQFKFTILTLFGWCKLSVVASIVCIIVYILMKCLRCSNRLLDIFWMLSTILVLVVFLFEHYHDGYRITSGYICYDTAVLLIPFSSVFFCEHGDKCWLYLTMGVGLICAYGCGSNNGYFVCTGGAVIVTIIIITYVCGHEFYYDFVKKAILLSFAILGIVIISMLCTVRYRYAYRDSNREELTEQIEYGPGKYIYTTPETKIDMMMTCDMIEDINQNYPGKRIIFTRLLPWGYVFSNGICAAPSEWRFELSSVYLQEYLEKHRDKYPEIVVVLNKNVGAHLYDKAPNENNFEGSLWDNMTTGWKHMSYPCAEVYINVD